MNRSRDELPEGRDVSVPLEAILVQAFGLSILLLVLPMALYAVIYGLGDLFSIFGTSTGALRFIFALGIFTLAHEAFHAVGWRYWGGVPWREIEFGFKWEAWAPYTHAKSPMRADMYRFGAALPGVMTGLLPYGLALVVGNGGIALVSAVMISGAVGDIYVLWIMRDVRPDALVIDHPNNAGCIVVKEGAPER